MHCILLVLYHCFDVFDNEICSPGKCQKDGGNLVNITVMVQGQILRIYIPVTIFTFCQCRQWRKSGKCYCHGAVSNFEYLHSSENLHLSSMSAMVISVGRSLMMVTKKKKGLEDATCLLLKSAWLKTSEHMSLTVKCRSHVASGLHDMDQPRHSLSSECARFALQQKKEDTDALTCHQIRIN